ncbi:helix-turn-helix domain-containing protein [Pusillimonas noertemannii]|nr:helix-turn-helix domain-containing protein [Pusillimonas noertemannii]
MSARGSRQDRLRGMEAGADAYLVKPVNFADLVLAIDQLWQKLRLRTSDTDTSASAEPALLPGLHALEGPPDRQAEAAALPGAAPKGDAAEEGADRLSLEAALRQRVVAFIEQNIHRPELSPRSISRRFNVSRSHLYRAFASDGGVAKFLRDKRLDAAARELTRAHSPAISIAELAHRLGFSSGNQFLRAFRNRFGITPSQAREQGAVPDPQLADAPRRAN